MDTAIKISDSTRIIIAILAWASGPRTYREIWAAATPAEQARLREASHIARRLAVMQRRGLVRASGERQCAISRRDAREWILA
jgi:hypothetical protein